MSKFAEIDPVILQHAVDTVQQCWNEGSPVAGSSPQRWQEIAYEAIRRIRSFDRRGFSQRSRTLKVRDIAKRLIEQFEDHPELVGPLIADYEYLAEKVLDVAIEVADQEH